MKKRSFMLLMLLGCVSLMANKPANVVETWQDYDPQKEPLKIKISKTWERDNGVFQQVCYSLGKLVGTNKTAEPIIAAFYGYPKGGTNLPAILHIHGGGQRAQEERVAYWVKLGYACISINWGALPLIDGLPNTNWDGLAAGFLGDNITKHYDLTVPHANTLFKEEHPLNCSWMLIAMAARRAITFLEVQKEVNKDKIGVEGHSMGGNATVHTVIDPRVKAASPSVGGSGYLFQDMWGLPKSARSKTEGKDYYEKVVSAQNYWPLIKCPILFLGSSNDFNSPLDYVVKGMSLLPKSTNHALALAPHLNHRFTESTEGARIFWMEANLKENIKFPKTSKAELVFNTPDNIPLFKVWPDDSSGLKIEKVDIYYGYARDPRVRFFRDAQAKRVDDHYEAQCPIFDIDEPLFAFANITYNANRTIPMPVGYKPTNQLTLTSDYFAIYPETLKANNVKVTEKQYQLIDDFSRGWHDWYLLNPDNPHHWFYSTRKIIDPSWMGVEKASLEFDIITTAANNKLAVGIEVNNWQNYTGRNQDSYYAIIDLPINGKNSVKLSVNDFVNKSGQKLKVWNEATELQFLPGNHAKVKNPPQARWQGASPTLADLRWSGGSLDGKILHPHEKRTTANSQKTMNFDQEFQNSIKASVELEEMDNNVATTDGKLYLTKELASLNNSYWRVMNDKGVEGKDISIGKQQFAKGIGVHANSLLAFNLGGNYKSFHVTAGPDDAHHGELEMKILVDNKEVFTTGKVRSNNFTAQETVIDVTGAKELKLVVDSLDNQGGDHASWGNAYLVK